MRLITKSLIVLVVVIIAGLLFNFFGPTAHGECSEIRKDLEYHCKYHSVNEKDDILISKYKALYSVRADGSDKPNLITYVPDSWVLMMNSISPNHERLLLTLKKPSCDTDWRQPKGRLCVWGREVIWYAYHEVNDSQDTEDDIWVLKNLAEVYGFNSATHGWTSWMNNKYAFFNGLSYPEDKPLPIITQNNEDDTQGYQIRFNSKTDVHIDKWGADKLYRKDCLSGRFYPSHIEDSDSCIDGAKVVYARRCNTEPDGNYWSYWNTVNKDGTGDKCVEQLPVEDVPVLRLFTVEVDEQCQPKSTFNIKNPIRQPDNSLSYTLMGAIAEWGDMQPAINQDATIVAFHTVKSKDSLDPNENCTLLQNKQNYNYAVLQYCELNENAKCNNLNQLPIYKDQYFAGQPFFFEEEDGTSILWQTLNGVVKTKIKPELGENIFISDGVGGYPLR